MYTRLGHHTPYPKQIRIEKEREQEFPALAAHLKVTKSARKYSAGQHSVA